MGPYRSDDPDSKNIWWSETGVNQNLTFPVQPDPISGMHCWHQRVRVEAAPPGDRYGDVFVDTRKSQAVYEEWKALTKPAPGPGGLRRPLWMNRPCGRGRGVRAVSATGPGPARASDRRRTRAA